MQKLLLKVKKIENVVSSFANSNPMINILGGNSFKRVSFWAVWNC